MCNKVKIIIGIITAIITIFIVSFYHLYNQLPNITLVEDLTVEKNDVVTNLQFIRSVKDGKIISNEGKIDTSKIGKKKIVITIVNKYGKKRTYQYFIFIVDNDS